ncbi:MAG: Rieske (2Fe-2S) protein [Dehalococcoidia bacterium]|nr:Rieske (2Fe-2S) protein [Dehalococcoidia bacterium]
MSDRFEDTNQYVETLLGQQRPRRTPVQDEGDLHALQFAARLAAGRDDEVIPTPEFLRILRTALVMEAQGQPQASRRGLLAAALAGLATGITGFLAGRFSAPPSEASVSAHTQVAPPSQPAMVRDNGRWFTVAHLSELREKQVVRFTAGSVEGHLVKYGNKVHALSAICSHLPCTLTYRDGSNDFLCPCHDVSFDLRGEAVNVRRSLGSADADPSEHQRRRRAGMEHRRRSEEHRRKPSVRPRRP